jgi:hypothetical protein
MILTAGMSNSATRRVSVSDIVTSTIDSNNSKFIAIAPSPSSSLLICAPSTFQLAAHLGTMLALVVGTTRYSKLPHY